MKTKEEILKSFGNTNFVSPYKLAKIESSLRGREIVPQKLYGYVRKNYITSTKSETGKIMISASDAVDYLIKQLSRDERLATQS